MDISIILTPPKHHWWVGWCHEYGETTASQVTFPDGWCWRHCYSRLEPSRCLDQSGKKQQDLLTVFLLVLLNYKEFNNQITKTDDSRYLWVNHHINLVKRSLHQNLHQVFSWSQCSNTRKLLLDGNTPFQLGEHNQCRPCWHYWIGDISRHWCGALYPIPSYSPSVLISFCSACHQL